MNIDIEYSDVEWYINKYIRENLFVKEDGIYLGNRLLKELQEEDNEEARCRAALHAKWFPGRTKKST